MAASSFPPRSVPLLKPVAQKELGAALGAGGPFDAVVFVTAGPFSAATAKPLAELRQAVDSAAASDASLFGGKAAVSCIPGPALAGGRLIIGTTGSLEHETDDVRRFAEAGASAIKRAQRAGATRPLLLVSAPPRDARYRRAGQVTLLGALGALWRPLEARMMAASANGRGLETIGFAVLGGADAAESCANAARVEAARYITRDITGTEPEQMAPEKVAAYCREVFAKGPIALDVLSDAKRIRKEYPLIAAVARASFGIARHEPRIIRLEYTPAGKVTHTVLLAGKGVTYDTGGADLKVNGHMAGMSRDKGGAGAIAGLFHWLTERRPKGLRVVGLLGMVRNSIGPEAYVTDEIIPSRAGVRIRVGNTDAEGRLVLADLLSALREEAEGAVSPSLFSIATLTGHAYRAVGPYTLLMGNGAARREKVAESIRAAGEEWGDPCEISTIRREDYSFVEARSDAEDLVSCNSEPSSMTARGHQFPFAFLDIASKIRDTSFPFVHIDIGGSAVMGGDWQFGAPTAAPLVALSESILRG
jgi:leucyl aminopeptidase